MKLNRELLCVYGVTNNAPSIESIEKAIKGGIKIVQLRMKNASFDEFLSAANKTKEVCKGKALLIINDNVEIARLSGADGVHLGQDDMQMKDARNILGDKIIGISAHNTEEALKAQQEGADYIGCGAMFPTESKGDVSPLSVEELTKICKAVEIPVVAIGGITLANMKYLKNTGADGIAVSKGLFSGDAEVNAKAFTERWGNLCGKF